MKKMLVAIFGDGEEKDFYDLLKFFEKRGYIKLVNALYINKVLKFDNIEIDIKYRTVRQNNINIELSNYEFDILYLLASHPNQVFSKKQIYEQVWNMPYLGAEDNVVSFIHRIRRKIEPDPVRPVYILTVWGRGYKFSDTTG